MYIYCIYIPLHQTHLADQFGMTFRITKNIKDGCTFLWNIPPIIWWVCLLKAPDSIFGDYPGEFPPTIISMAMENPPIFIGKPSINRPFSMAMLNNQELSFPG